MCCSHCATNQRTQSSFFSLLGKRQAASMKARISSAVVLFFCIANFIVVHVIDIGFATASSTPTGYLCSLARVRAVIHFGQHQRCAMSSAASQQNCSQYNRNFKHDVFPLAHADCDAVHGVWVWDCSFLGLQWLSIPSYIMFAVVIIPMYVDAIYQSTIIYIHS